MKIGILFIVVAMSFLLVSCSSFVKEDAQISSDSSGDVEVSDTLSHDVLEQDGGCYDFISKDNLDAILKSDVVVSDYDGLGSCKYKAEKGGYLSQLRIVKTSGSDWYNKQKEFFTSENNIYMVEDLGDEAFGKGFTTIYFLKGGDTWMLDLYTNDEALIPELTTFNEEYNEENKQLFEDHVNAVVKELAVAVANT